MSRPLSQSSSPEQYQGDAFADGYSAMAIVGPWAVSFYKDVDWAAVPVPTPDAGTGLYGTGLCPSRAAHHHPWVPGSPWTGPTTFDVTPPP